MLVPSPLLVSNMANLIHFFGFLPGDGGKGEATQKIFIQGGSSQKIKPYFHIPRDTSFLCLR